MALTSKLNMRCGTLWKPSETAVVDSGECSNSSGALFLSMAKTQMKHLLSFFAISGVFGLGCGSAQTTFTTTEPLVADVTPSDPVANSSCPGPHYRRSEVDGELHWVGENGAAPLDLGDGIREILRDDLDGDGLDDSILSLGACGNWGECVQVIVRGCSDGRHSLATDPDTYVWELTVEDSGDSVTLWETTRGGSAAADDIGRVRWAFREGRFVRTDEYELIQLMRAFGEPEPREVRRGQLEEELETACQRLRCFEHNGRLRVFHSAENDRLGLLHRAGEHWEMIEPLEAASMGAVGSIVVRDDDGGADDSIVIEVLGQDGSALRIRVSFGDELRWEEQTDP